MMSQNHVIGIYHHKQICLYQNMFVKNVKSLYQTYIEYGNLLDHNNMLYNIFARTATCLPSAISSIMSLESVEKQQYETFVRERLLDQVVSIETTFKNNKLHLIKAQKDSKSKSSKVKHLKNLTPILPFILPAKFLVEIHSNSFHMKMLNIPY